MGYRFLIPYAYKNNITEFFDRLTVFQDKEYLNYLEHNTEFVQLNKECFGNQISFIVPYKLRTEKEDVIWDHIKKQVLNQYQKHIKDYIKAYIEIVRQTQSSQNQNQPHQTEQLRPKPQTNKPQSTEQQQSKKNPRPIIKKTPSTNKKNMLTKSAELVANIACGVAASPLALAYKFFDKNARIVRSPQHRKWIENKAIPYIKKGVYKALIFAALAASPKVVQTVKQLQQEKAKKEMLIAKAKEDKQAFFKKYDTQSEIFYQNYQKIKKYEEVIVAAIACPESFKETAYLCAAGEYTIGYGSRRIVVDGQYDDKGFQKTVPVKPGDTISQEKAYESCIAHLDKYVIPQFNYINRELNVPQIVAVCMFIYNTNEKTFADSCVCKAVNSGTNEDVRKALSLYRKANGERNFGLVERRGFEGLIYAMASIEELVKLKPQIFGSPDMCYFECIGNNKEKLKENPDQTFNPCAIEYVRKCALKFKTEYPNNSILSKLPKKHKEAALKALGMTTKENGTFSKTKPNNNSLQFDLLRSR